jgi:hypothetical protein
MKLYELPRQSKFTLTETPYIPVDSNDYNPSDVFTLHNIDGMYSYCVDIDGVIHHFAAWTEVNVHN